MPDIIAAASPSALYDRMLNDAHGWFNPPNFEPRINMHLVVHLSGGAFKSKLGEDMLKPLGLSANLTDLFDPPPIMKKCAQWRGMSDEGCYKTWNGGQGAAVVVDAENVEAFIAKATSYGIQAKAAGIITKRNSDYTVAITSKFSGETIRY
jgi:phosphoribosylaminoimidazole (AIR) synthetase